MQLDALGELVAQAVRPRQRAHLPIVLVACWKHRLPVLAKLDPALAPGQRVTGRQPADARNDGARRDDPAVGKELAQRLNVGPGLDRARREDRLLLRAE